MNPAPLVKGPMRKRADILLVERGFFSSRARAQAAIAAGLVSVGGVALKKASEEVAGDAPIEAEAPTPGRRAAGSSLPPRSTPSRSILQASSASTSAPRPEASPTSCSRAARRRSSPSMSATDSSIRASRRTRASARSKASTRARSRRRCSASGRSAIVIDVSFISQRLVLPHVLKLAAERAWLVSLVKPQFELGKPISSKAGSGAKRRSSARATRCAPRSKRKAGRCSASSRRRSSAAPGRGNSSSPRVMTEPSKRFRSSRSMRMGMGSRPMARSFPAPCPASGRWSGSRASARSLSRR